METISNDKGIKSVWVCQEDCRKEECYHCKTLQSRENLKMGTVSTEKSKKSAWVCKEDCRKEEKKKRNEVKNGKQSK